MRTMAIVRTFVDATSACDAIPLTADNAGDVWEAVSEVWNNSGGPMLNGDLIATLYRYSYLQVSCATSLRKKESVQPSHTTLLWPRHPYGMRLRLMPVISLLVVCRRALEVPASELPTEDTAIAAPETSA